MKRFLGLRTSLALSFIALAIVLLWLNHTTATHLRDYVVRQREMGKALAVASMIEPMIRHESEWVRSVSHLLQQEASAAMRLTGSQRDEALAALLDRAYRNGEVDVLEITDRTGVVRYRAQDPAKKGDEASYWGIEEALAGNATLISVRRNHGPLILYVEPIRADGKIIGVLCTGRQIDERFVRTLGRELGAAMALVSNSGEIAASSEGWTSRPDPLAITEAFQHKDVAFRSNDGSRVTQAYLPVLVVDDAWVMVTEIDSASAFLAIDVANRKVSWVMAGSIATVVLLVFLLLRVNLAPLRSLRRRAEALVAGENEAPPALTDGDDLESVIRSLDSLTDILERRNRLLKIQRASLSISAVAFESQQAMAITTPQMEVVTVNKAFTASTGFELGDIVGRTLDLLPPDIHGTESMQDLTQALLRSGQWQGEARARRRSGETFPVWLSVSAVRDEAGTTTHFVVSQTDLSENRKMEQKLRELAFYDPTTGLPNRRLLMDRLKQATAICGRDRKHGAVLLIDIDDFKTLNTTLGHATGDQLLREVALRLKGCSRDAETLARLGGDEFVMLLCGLSESPEEAATQAEKAGERILDAFASPFRIDGCDFHCTAGIGVTLFTALDGRGEDLLRQANLALLRTKDGVRGGLRFFDTEMQSSLMERTELESALRRAIETDQLVLHYQPLVLADGRIVGCEALVRWNRPERGMIPPGDFIPLAEHTGLIVPLGRWVLNSACVKLAEWARRPALAHLTVGVNVSARQFHQPDFVDQVRSILETTGANPARLKLELTESILVANTEEVVGKMLALKESGVAFSLDDFGTGYSSLSYLKRLPLEQLKIDRSFVRDILDDPNDAAIATTIIALAENLGLEVIAEGVETAGQRDFLANSGCHAYQGYFFSKPLPAAEFEIHVVANAKTSPFLVDLP